MRYWLSISGLSTLLLFLGNELVASDDVGDVLRDAVTTLNHELPLMIDSETRLDASGIEAMRFKYDYTLVNLDAANIDVTAFARQLDRQTTSKACAAGASRGLLDRGVEFVYAYRGRNGTPLGTVEVTRADC